jgi:hypothetical protein
MHTPCPSRGIGYLAADFVGLNGLGRIFGIDGAALRCGFATLLSNNHHLLQLSGEASVPTE